MGVRCIVKICYQNKITNINQQNAKVSYSPHLKVQNQKQFQANSLEVAALQNQSFCGLKKPQADARFLDCDLKMEPKKEYIVDDSSVFEFANLEILDLSSPEINSAIKALKPCQHIDFEKYQTNFSNGGENSLEELLRVRRKLNGKLVASDLGSSGDTTICKNLVRIPNLDKEFKLKPNTKYLMPLQGGIKMCQHSIYYLPDLEKRLKSMKEKETLIIGGADDCDVVVRYKNVLPKHLNVTKYDKNIVVEDISSTNDATYMPSHSFAGGNFVNTQYKRPLYPRYLTKIPQDCQLYLGHSFALDVQNQNLLDELNCGRSIYVGTDPECDIKVNSFHSVDDKHLKLIKQGDELFAMDLGSQHGTEVIPRNEVKPFYCDISKLHLSQSNIGDCYLLATIYAMSRSPKGQKILERMASVDDNGNYNVKFFLKKPIKVSLDELDGQTTGIEIMRSVSGELGLKAIERAYAKMVKDDDGSILSRGKQSEPTLFFKINGGNPTIALKKMTGIKSNIVYTRKTNLAPLFEKFSQNMDNYILTCATYDTDGVLEGRGANFRARHGYAIKAIDSASKLIMVANPHDTRFSYPVSWDEFSNIFTELYYADLSSKQNKVSNLVYNLTTSSNE